jgi:type II secretory pathway pseudopilin PulG
MRQRQQGFSYVVVMFLVAILAVVSVRALENARTDERRAKEAELMWIGMSFRKAIANYYAESQGSAKAYPKSLKDLLYHSELTNPTRPLRKIYRDPFTGTTDWGVVKNADGGVIGVYSLSQQKPLKRDGFPLELAGFVNAQHYSDWKFVYLPAN